jgi:hypothetical protein
MTLNRSNLLPEDIELIRQHGVPLELNPQFLLIEDDGSLRFSERGRAVYMYACALTALSPHQELERVRDVETLQALSLKIKQLRMLLSTEALARAKKGEKVPARSRAVVDAALHGTLGDLRAAVAALNAADAAGSNVIPVNFKKLRRM